MVGDDWDAIVSNVEDIFSIVYCFLFGSLIVLAGRYHLHILSQTSFWMT